MNTHKETMNDFPEDQLIDWVDPETAEVKQMDGLQHLLTSHCARQEEFLTEHTTLVDAVFRTFLANGNTPMTPRDFNDRTWKTCSSYLENIGWPKGLQRYSTSR